MSSTGTVKESCATTVTPYSGDFWHGPDALDLVRLETGLPATQIYVLSDPERITSGETLLLIGVQVPPAERLELAGVKAVLEMFEVTLRGTYPPSFERASSNHWQ